MSRSADRARRLIEEHGRTFAEEAGIHLTDKPSPLYRLLVLTVLLSKPISSDLAVAGARALSQAGYRTPRRVLDATWQQRVDALGRGHYRRFDESTATILGEGAALILDRWHGDLRRLRDEGGGDPAYLMDLLQQVPGIGPTGSEIFLREVQAVWIGVRPFLDDTVLTSAEQQGLPHTARGLAATVDADDLARLGAALVRVRG